MQNNGNGNKMRTYCKFKNNFNREIYLDTIKDIKHKKYLAEFRTSTHKLRIETGRYEYQKLPSADRTCLVCQNGAVEDEEHFLMQCTAYTIPRKQLYAKALEICPQFKNLNVKKQFIWLMSAEADIPGTVAHFLVESYDIRQKILSAS